MTSKVLGLFRLSRCQHKFSWPRRRTDGDFYQVCLLCGEEYKYDWNAMRRTAPIVEASPDTQPLRQNGPVDRDGERPKKLSWVPRARRVRVTGSGILYRRAGAAAWQRGRIENISSSGVFFHCKEVLAEKTEVELFLEMPTEITGQENSRVLAHGMIVRCHTADERGKCSIAARIWDYRFVHDGQAPGQLC